MGGDTSKILPQPALVLVLGCAERPAQQPQMCIACTLWELTFCNSALKLAIAVRACWVRGSLFRKRLRPGESPMFGCCAATVASPFIRSQCGCRYCNTSLGFMHCQKQLPAASCRTLAGHIGRLPYCSCWQLVWPLTVRLYGGTQLMARPADSKDDGICRSSTLRLLRAWL